MKNSLTLIPTLSLNPSQIAIYQEPVWEPNKPIRKDYNPELNAVMSQYAHLLESDRKSHGAVSPVARRKMRKAVDYILLINGKKTGSNNVWGSNFKYRIAFVTLTLPSKQVHSDKEIKSKCLNQFLIEIKKYHQVRNFIWRAEKQKNGNIHFHLLIDTFIGYHKLRDRWNRIVEKLGYVTRYREEQKAWHKNGFKPREHLLNTWPIEKQKKAYLNGKRTNWHSPNSTDIHSIYRINDIKSYITKYMTKEDQPAPGQSEETEEILPETGRIWGCNQELSKARGLKVVIDSEIEEELRYIEKTYQPRKLNETYFTCLFISFDMLSPEGTPRLFKLFMQYLFDIFHFNYNFQIAA